MATREIVDRLGTQIDNVVSGIHETFTALAPDIELADLANGSAKSNKRISNAVMEISSKLKALSKLAFRARGEIVEHGKQKKAIRMQSKPITAEQPTQGPPPPPPPK